MKPRARSSICSPSSTTSSSATRAAPTPAIPWSWAAQTFKLSLVPSGIFPPDVQCVVAAGVVLNPASLLEEIDGLVGRGVAVGRNLMISDRAHVIFPWHFEEDRLLNEPARRRSHRHHAARHRALLSRQGRPLHAIRLGDMYRDRLPRADRADRAAPSRARRPGRAGRRPALDAAEIYRQYHGYAERLRPYVADTTTYLLDAVEAGKKLLFEGAQGALLDIDHGTFPFVTSSNSPAWACRRFRRPGRYITKVVGVLKAYCTRVGGGPFPTEQDNAIGQHIRERGNEYGTVTRRPRRCGWFDAVAARYTARLSGVDCLAVMLLDVLGEMPELKICTAYELDGRRMTDFPSQIEDLRRVRRSTKPCLVGKRKSARPPHGRSAARRPGTTSTGSANSGSARGNGFRRARPRANDFRVKGHVQHDGEQTKPRETARRAAGKDAAAHGHHHGRQRPLGSAARLAAYRGASPRRGERPPHHRGMRPPGHRATHALQFFQRKLEAAAEEIDFLMHLLQQYMIEQRPDHEAPAPRDGHRPPRGPARRDAPRNRQTVALSSHNTGLGVCLAINYGSRAELVDAVREIAQKVRAGQLAPSKSTSGRSTRISTRPE